MRVVLRLLARLLGLVLAGVGALLALEAGWVWARPGADPLVVPWMRWQDTLSPYSWADTEVLTAAGVLAGVGLLALLLVRAARRRDVRLADPTEGVSVVTSPRALARFVGQQVRSEDGVADASVTATRRRVRVRAETALYTSAELQPALTSTVRELVAGLPLTRSPRVRVAVTSSRERR